MRYRYSSTGVHLVNAGYSLRRQLYETFYPPIGKIGNPTTTLGIKDVAAPSRSATFIDDPGLGRRLRDMSALRNSASYNISRVKGSWPAKKCRHVVAVLDDHATSIPAFDMVRGLTWHSYYEYLLTATPWAILWWEFGKTPSVLSNDAPANSPPSPIYSIDWDSMYESYQDSLNSITGQEVLLGEFLSEPGILASAIEIVIKPSKSIKKFVQWGLNPSVRSKRLSLKGALAHYGRGAAGAHLGLEFGVKPLIQDLNNIWNVNRKVEKSVDFLKKSMGSWIHVGATDSLSVPASAMPSATGSPYTDYLIGYKNTSINARMGAQGRVRKDQNRFAMWKAYSDYFQIGRITDLAWELVPFSFVVDWFSNAGDYIHNVSRVQDPIFSELRNFCVSTTEITGRSVYLYPRTWRYIVTANSPIPPAPIAIASDDVRIFTRDLSFPSNTGSVVSFEKLGLWHLITSGALLVQLRTK